MEMKPVHCCLLLVVVCILFLSITLLEGEQNNLQKVKSCSKLTEAKEMSYIDAATNALRLKRSQTAMNIAEKGGPGRGKFEGYFTDGQEKPGTPIQCKDLKRDAVDCDEYYATMNGVKRRCGYSDNEYDKKCSHGIACNPEIYRRQDDDGYNLKQLKRPDKFLTCNFKYKNNEYEAWGYEGVKFWSGSAVGRTGLSRDVSLQPVPSDQPINAHLDNNNDTNPCGKFQGKLRDNNHRYTICGDGWIWKDDKYVCPVGNCVDTTAGGEANVCEKQREDSPKNIERKKNDICGNAVEYLCGEEGENIEQCIIDNYDTLVEDVCNFPSLFEVPDESIDETNIDTIYQKYQDYINNDNKPIYFKKPK